MTNVTISLGACGQASSERTDTEDPLGRRTKTTSTQFIATGQTTDFVRQWSYDKNFGRVKAETFPTGDVHQLHYSRYGQVTSEMEWTAQQLLRTVNSINGRGEVTSETYGNGLVGNFAYASTTGQMTAADYTRAGAPVRPMNYDYDVFGNVTRQFLGTDGTTTETYQYDALFRLAQSTRNIGAGSPTSVNYSYDAAGNFRKKTDFSADVADAYTYVAGTNKLQSVNALSGPHNYAYDANGNLQSDGAGFTAYYGLDNLPSKIQRGTPYTFMAYGASGEKVREWGSDGTRIQVGGYEKVTGVPVPAGSPDASSEKVYLGDYAVLTRVNATTKHFEWLLKDRLGSVEAVADATGTLIEKRGSDAFGKPRTDVWGDTSALASIGITPRGFTEHEHLNSVQIIHMKGRAYDYSLGRFLSVDPIIQFPTNSQSLNPYSYILNNPLSGTDPTGYFGEFDDGPFTDSSQFTGRNAGCSPFLRLCGTPTWNGAQDSDDKKNKSSGSSASGSLADRVLAKVGDWTSTYETYAKGFLEANADGLTIATDPFVRGLGYYMAWRQPEMYSVKQGPTTLPFGAGDGSSAGDLGYGVGKAFNTGVAYGVVLLAPESRLARGPSFASETASIEGAAPRTLTIPREKAGNLANYQRAAEEGTLVRTDPSTVRGSGFRKQLIAAKGPPPGSGYDADHIVELCVGGPNCAGTNGQWLQFGPNRAAGSKLGKWIENDPIGTRYSRVEVEEIR